MKILTTFTGLLAIFLCACKPNNEATEEASTEQLTETVEKTIPAPPSKTLDEEEDSPPRTIRQLSPEPRPTTRKGKFIDYNVTFEGDRKFTGLGYLVLPEGASPENPVPGIVVVHEWWGQTEYIRKRTEMLAELGYAAFAIDMYGNGETSNTINGAGQLMFQVTQEPWYIEERFMAGMNVLQQQRGVDAKKIAAVGYSVGGKMAMQVAAYNPDNLLGVVVFHGAPDIEILKGTTEIKPKILICNGADDTLIIQESVDEFMEDIANVKTDITWEKYPGVINGFTNPDSNRINAELGSTVAYNKEADEKSWNSMKTFLTKLFQE